RAMLDSYMARNDLPLASPRVALLDLAYHDVNRARGLYYVIEKAGRIERVTEDHEINLAMREPPQTTRAKLRGDFIKQAKAKRRDNTVDWVHLKLNDQAQRTVLCKDPFRSVDERVEQLIAHMWREAEGEGARARNRTRPAGPAAARPGAPRHHHRPASA